MTDKPDPVEAEPAERAVARSYPITAAWDDLVESTVKALDSAASGHSGRRATAAVEPPGADQRRVRR